MSIQSVPHIYPNSLSYAYFLGCFKIQMNFSLSIAAQSGTIGDISGIELSIGASVWAQRGKVEHEDYG